MNLRFCKTPKGTVKIQRGLTSEEELSGLKMHDSCQVWTKEKKLCVIKKAMPLVSAALISILFIILTLSFETDNADNDNNKFEVSVS